MKARGTKEQHVANVTRLKKEFLDHYSKLSSIWAAAEKIGVDRQTVWRWRKTDKKFDAAVLEGFDANTDLLHATAVARALSGTSKGADTLLMFLLKSREPEKYRERYDVKGSTSFTLNDFLMHWEREAAKGLAGDGQGLRPPGRVLDRAL